MFFFNLKRQNKNRLILAIGSETNLQEALINFPKEYLTSHLSVDEVFLVAPVHLRQAIQGSLNNNQVIASLERLLPAWSKNNISALLIGYNYTCEYLQGRSDASHNASEMAREFLTCGAFSIFDRRDGLIIADSSCHFVKPSGKTTQWFIKTANVLVNSGEIDFLALGILFQLQRAPTNIYCDTAGIHALAYSVKSLLASEQIVESRSPLLIESFNSYIGIETFVFRTSSRALVLISSSTSGDLVDKIVDKNIPAENIFTIFYRGGTSPRLGKCICDLTEIDAKFQYTIKRRLAREVGENVPDSLPIVLQNEWFAVGERHVKRHLLTVNDVPAWLRKEQASIGSSKVLAAFGKSSTRNQEYENLISFNKIWEPQAASLRSRVLQYIRARIPSTVALILADAEVARLLKKSRRVWFPTMQAKQIVELTNADEITEEKIASNKPIVVITGNMRTGRRLLDVSRSLRNATSKQGNRIVYVNIFGLLAEIADYRDLEANLCYGNTGPDHNVACSVYKLCASTSGGTWQEEQKHISNGLKRIKHLSQVDKNELENRRNQLAKAHAGRSAYYFCPDLRGNHLSLRDNFAFDFMDGHEGGSSTRFSQSEVYFTISAILHSLRNGDTDRHPLRQRVNCHTILAPSNFDRFNDGLVQGSILRAAIPVELEYSSLEDDSSAMSDIILGVFKNIAAQQGEAAAEFALALSVRRLRLAEKDMKVVVREGRRLKGLAGAYMRLLDSCLFGD